MHYVLAILIWAIMQPGHVSAEGKAFRLSAAEELIATGFLKYLLPRFALKTGVKVSVVPLGEDADASLSPAAEGVTAFQHTDGRVYRIGVTAGPSQDHADRFQKWLLSAIGQKAVAKFKVDAVAQYTAVAEVEVVEAEELIEGDAVLGEEIALRRCGRCHVVSEKNRFGGIGSTPSFGAMKTLPRWRERFETFWTLNPHPSFTQIKDVTDPFDPARPPPIAPLELTLDDLDALMAFVLTIKKKDLGPALVQQ